MASLGDKQDRFSRWVRSLVERRGYWRAAVAIAAKNARMAWATLKYGEPSNTNRRQHDRTLCPMDCNQTFAIAHQSNHEWINDHFALPAVM